MKNETDQTDNVPRPYRLEEQVGYMLRLAGQRHTSIFQEVLPFDLTAMQFSVLVRLDQLGECSQNELGRRTAMDIATIKGVVDRLRKKGLILVSPDANDKRRALLSIAKGHEDLVPQLWKAGFQISEETLMPLTKKERVDFQRLLSKLIEGQS